ncbi:hypothetical protein A5872_000756 [Enterococcus faecium]|nr:hypothetical protein A5872_000756 [Enterococcus faecium]
MDEFQMIKSTLISIKEYVSMISSFPNESDRNSVIRPVSYTHLDVYKRQFLMKVIETV